MFSVLHIFTPTLNNTNKITKHQCYFILNGYRSEKHYCLHNILPAKYAPLSISLVNNCENSGLFWICKSQLLCTISPQLTYAENQIAWNIGERSHWHCDLRDLHHNKGPSCVLLQITATHQAKNILPVGNYIENILCSSTGLLVSWSGTGWSEENVIFTQ